MGKLQQFRARAMSLRGAIAVGGALVMAAGLVQASGTLAQDVEVREATAGIATQNYYPTPLASDISCSPSGTAGFRYANVSWSPPDPAPGTAPTSYRYRVDWADEDGVIRHSFETSSTSTGNFRIRDELGAGDAIANSYRIRVHTINMENSVAVSSGYRSHTVYSATRWDTYCTGDPYPISDAPNAAWENQYDWDTSVVPESTSPAPSIFGADLDGDASRDLPGDMPEMGQLTLLDEATSDTAPTTSENSTSTQAPSTSTTSTSTSRTATSSSPHLTTTRVMAPSSSPSTAPSSSTSSASTLTTSTSVTTPTPATTTTTAPPPAIARVGDDPIAVGASQARLEEADDQTQLIVTRSGSEVCSAEVDGASRIESAEGALSVTVSGRTRTVDLETCELT